MAANQANADAVAFSRSGDANLGEFEDAVILRCPCRKLKSGNDSVLQEYAIAAKARWANPAEIKQQFGNTVDFVGDNRVIFDLGGNKYRLVVHVSYAFGRVLVKFIGTHSESDRIDPEIVSWRKK